MRDSEKLKLGRRDFLLGGSAALLFPVSGCVFLLFRLLLRGGVARSIGRAGVSRAAGLAARGTAVSTNYALLRGASVRNLRHNGTVLMPNRRIVARTEGKNGRSEVRNPKGALVSRSYQERDDLTIHTDRFDNRIGQSIRDTDRKTVHFDALGRIKRGYDILDRTQNFIDHFNTERREDRFIGRSKIGAEGKEFTVDSDSEYAKDLAVFEKTPGCPELDQIEKKVLELRQACANGDQDACYKASRLNTEIYAAAQRCG